jgi:WD40 repeat protein
MAKGEIRVEKSAPAQAGQAAAQAPIPTIIPAAQSSLSQIAVDVRGTRLAAASQKGTLLRVFDTATGQLIDMFRRGSSQAAIQSLAFNHDGSMLAVSSDKGTIHFFHIQGENKTSRYGPLSNPCAGSSFCFFCGLTFRGVSCSQVQELPSQRNCRRLL